jgi:hypothetical protein
MYKLVPVVTTYHCTLATNFAGIFNEIDSCLNRTTPEKPLVTEGLHRDQYVQPHCHLSRLL